MTEATVSKMDDKLDKISVAVGKIEEHLKILNGTVAEVRRECSANTTHRIKSDTTTNLIKFMVGSGWGLTIFLLILRLLGKG